MSAVRTGESDGEPEQLTSRSANKVTGKFRQTTRPKLMAFLRLPTLTSETGQSIRFPPSHHDDRMSGWICNFTAQPTALIGLQ
jgi:hypothetical protein